MSAVLSISKPTCTYAYFCQSTFFALTVGEDYTYSFDPAGFVFTPDGGSVLSIDVEIIDDEVFEGREDFSLILDSAQPRVIFNPQQTSIAITDNEGEEEC